MTVLLLIIGLLLFIGLVVIHEFGHFIFARRNGVEVEEFGIFFPPRLYKRRMKGGWDFTINLLPLGGFVKLKGEHDSDTAKGTYGAATLWVKTKIMGAGVLFNLLTALVLLTILAVIGMPKLIPNQYTVKSDTKLASQRTLITFVDKGSPAAKAGIQTLDEITDIRLPGYSPVAIPNSDALPKITKNFAGKTVVVYYIHEGEHKQATTTLLTTKAVKASQNTKDPKGYLGIVPSDYVTQKSTWSAPVTAVGLSVQVTVLTFQGLWHAISGLGSIIAGFVTVNHTARVHGQTEAASQVGGPIAIYFILKSGSAEGYQYMLLIMAIISLTLAIMNILPVPALDGGRLWITLVAHAIKKPLSAKTEEIVNLTGFVVLISLMILISFVDFHRFF